MRSNNAMKPARPSSIVHPICTMAIVVALVLIGSASAQEKPAIVLSAATHNFVSVGQGSSMRYGIHLTNKSGAPFNFALSLEGSKSFAQNNNCPVVVAPGGGCEIIFTYTAPSESQWENATVTLPTSGVPLVMADGKPVPSGNVFYLKAHAVPPGVISVNSSKHDFDAVAVGSAAGSSFGLLVANPTESAVPFSFKASGDVAAYNVESNCPASIAPNGQCSLSFSFKPTAKGWQQMQVELNTGSVPVQGGNKVTLVGKGS
jgi:hypothetical protein